MTTPPSLLASLYEAIQARHAPPADEAVVQLRVTDEDGRAVAAGRSGGMISGDVFDSAPVDSGEVGDVAPWDMPGYWEG